MLTLFFTGALSWSVNCLLRHGNKKNRKEKKKKEEGGEKQQLGDVEVQEEEEEEVPREVSRPGAHGAVIVGMK